MLKKSPPPESWYCEKCHTLLGVGRTPRMHLRYKKAQYVVCGSDFDVTATCRNCSTINVRHGGKGSPPVAPTSQ